VILYELRDRGGRAFSPFCWRSRMALAHKGIRPQVRQVCFTEIAGIAPGTRTVPVLVDGDTMLRDSWDVAVHLDEVLPGVPALMPTEGDRRLARFVHHWTTHTLHPLIFRAIGAEIWDVLEPADQPYFRESRERRLRGMRLEDLRDGRHVVVTELQSALGPLEALLVEQEFLGGGQASYADYILFGALQWARVIGGAHLFIKPDGALDRWFAHCLDLHGGVGRQEAAGP